MPLRIIFWSGPTTQNLNCVTKQAKKVNPDQGIFGFLIMFPVPVPCFRGRCGAYFGWRPNANKRPGQFGTGLIGPGSPARGLESLCWVPEGNLDGNGVTIWP